MSASSDIPNGNFELTSTLNLSNLRAVPDAKSDSQVMDLLSSNEREIIEQIPGNCAMLISLAGPGKGSRFLLDRDSVKIGRDALSDIFWTILRFQESIAKYRAIQAISLK